jgi:hypothetical protein
MDLNSSPLKGLVPYNYNCALHSVELLMVFID